MSKTKVYSGSLLLLVCAVANAHADSFAVSDDQLARLGVRLGAAETVDRVEVAAAPAEVVVPPAQQAVVSAPVDGVVARLLVAEGEPVTKGQTLAELDSKDFLQWQREYLEAAVAAELAAAQLARDHDLHDEGIIAARRLQETQAQAHAAEVRLDQAGEQLRLAGFDDAARKALVSGRRLSARLVLRAPFDGVVAAVHAKVGARVDSLDAVISIADLRTLWLELHLSQENAAKVERGMVGAVKIGTTDITGPVTVVGRVVDPATQTVLVRVEVENAHGLLRAGQFLAAQVLAPIEHTTYALPAAAVTRSGGAIFVFVREPSGFAARRIEVVAEDGSRVYVTAGIDRDARVAVEGISALKSLWLSTQEAGS
jgi:membrane fusion protein, heavy metal efflux system